MQGRTHDTVVRGWCSEQNSGNEICLPWRCCFVHTSVLIERNGLPDFICLTSSGATATLVRGAGARPAVKRRSVQPSRGGGFSVPGRCGTPLAAAAAAPPAGVAPQGPSPIWSTGCTCFCFSFCWRGSCMLPHFISLFGLCLKCKSSTECSIMPAPSAIRRCFVAWAPPAGSTGSRLPIGSAPLADCGGQRQ